MTERRPLWALNPELMTTSDAARRLGMSYSGQEYIQQLILTGRLPAEKVGRMWCIKKADLDELGRTLGIPLKEADEK